MTGCLRETFFFFRKLLVLLEIENYYYYNITRITNAIENARQGNIPSLDPSYI